MQRFKETSRSIRSIIRSPVSDSLQLRISTPQERRSMMKHDPQSTIGVRDIPIYAFPVYDIPRGRKFADNRVPINRILHPLALRNK
jgi:hypothetical protein